jgi:WD40 repeat protein
MGNNVEQKPLFILKGHKQSIDLIKFSPNGKYLVSVCNSDGTLFVWENGESAAKNKLSKPVNVLLFDWNQDLLTIGNGYVKVWKFDNGKILRKKEGEYWMIEGKLINLGKNFTLRNYIDSAIFHNEEEPNNQKLILLSEEGFLGTISHSYEKIEKWVDLGMPKTSSLQISGNIALCAGDNAVVKIIDLVSLTLKGKFPKPPPLKK